MNKQRRATVDKIISELQGLSAQLGEIASEEQDYYDNMPESFQSGEKGEAAQATAEALQAAVDAIDEQISELENAIAG